MKPNPPRTRSICHSTTLFLLVLAFGAAFARAQVADNDRYTNRTRIDGTLVQLTASNRGATMEGCERLLVAGADRATLWWIWSHNLDGLAVVCTTNTPLDTALGVFLGKDVCNLDLVATNDNAGAGLRSSWVAFDAISGEDYQFVVDTRGGTGEFDLHLKLYTIPEVLEQPVDLDVAEQLDASFGILALGARPLRYQWQFQPDGSTTWSDLQGATGPTLKVTAATRRANQGNYRCTVSNSYGTATSDPAHLGVLTPPLVVPPLTVGGSFQTCSNFCLTVKAVGEEPLRYQWQYRASASADWTDHPDPSAETARLCLSDISTNAAGDYRVIVSNNAGRATNAPVTVNVPAPLPLFTLQPKDTNTVVGLTCVLTAKAAGCRDDEYQYQWYKRPVGSAPGSEVLFAGHNETTMVLDPVKLEDAGYYLLIVTDGDGRQARSREALVTVEPRPPNDEFRNRFLIPPLASYTTDGFNKHGTAQAGEPSHNGQPPLHSVWWNYITNVQGVASIDLTGTTFRPRLAVYTGLSVSNLTALQLFPDGAKLKFGVGPNIEYQIVIDGVADADQGNLKLKFEFKEVGPDDKPSWLSEPVGFLEIGEFELEGGGCRTHTLLGQAQSVLLVDYSWLFNGVPIPGAKSPSLTLTNLSVEDAGFYQLVATNRGGAITSRVAQVDVTAQPHFLDLPRLEPGRTDAYPLCSAVKLVASAESCSPLTYQWRHNALPVFGATNATLSLPSLTPSLGGPWDLIILNHHGAVTSRVVQLDVNAKPPITRTPDRATFQLCETVTLRFNPTGCDSPSYQWLLNGLPVPNATNASYTAGPLTPELAGEYAVQIRLGSEVVTSAPMGVGVNPLTTFTQDLADKSYRDCDPVSWCITPAASSCVPLTYQWFAKRTGESALLPLLNATNACLAIDHVSVADSGTYQVAIMNPYGTNRSRVATLTVDARPQISEQPVTQRVRFGDSFTNRIAASSCSPLSYFWFRDGKAVVPDANHRLLPGGSLVIGAASTNDAGVWRCAVSNALSGVVSADATIRVVTPPPNDHFVNRLPLRGAVLTNLTATRYESGELFHNELATAETGEPRHADQVGGRSVWWTWTAPTPGRVTLDTAGSTRIGGGALDTLLAVYTGDSVTNLHRVEADDNSAGNGASRVTFLAARGRVFQIVVDGKGASEGNIQLHLSEEEIISPPIIDQSPISLAATNGETATFSVDARGSPDLLYQWTKDGALIPGATNASLVLKNVQPSDEGNYRVTVSNEYPPATNSPIARLTFGSIMRGQVTDATNDEPIPGARVAVGDISTLTDLNGNYELVGVQPGEVHADFYAVKRTVGLQEPVQFRDVSTLNAVSLTCIKRPEYIDFEDSQFIPIRGQSVTNKISMSPVLTGMRFVLNWGLEPADLDVMLFVRQELGSCHQVDYLWVGKGGSNAPPYVTFDKDVRKSYGPETVTLHRLRSGTYRLYVKKFSESARGTLTTSRAVMRIYERDPLSSENRHLGSLDVPKTGTGSYWHVADIDGATQVVTWINTIETVPPTLDCGASPGPLSETSKPELAADESAVARADRAVATAAAADSGAGSPRLQSAQPQPFSYLWEFGDGATSTNREPVHKYFKPGCYDVALTIRQHRAAGDFTDRAVRTCFITVTNGLPVVNLLWPPDRRIFRAGDPIPLEPSAFDTDRIPEARKIARVEAFRIIGTSTNLLQTFTAEPYSSMFTTTTEPGFYKFITRATDDHGAATWSAPVTCDVRDLSGEVLIIRNRPDPEITLVEEELLDMDIPVESGTRTGVDRRPPVVRILDQDGLHFDLVRGFRLIIWDDVGLATEGITTNDVSVLRQAWSAGIPLYLIGEHLASDARRLEPLATRTNWTDLIQLTTDGQSVGAGPITFEEPVIENELFRSGWYGVADEFPLPRPVELTKLASDAGQVRATREGVPVLIRTPRADVLDVFNARRVSQTYLLGGGDAGSDQRRLQFRNTVLWLLRNECDYFSVMLSLPRETLDATAGESIILRASIGSDGRCPANAVIVSNLVAAGLEVLETNVISAPVDGVNPVDIRRAGNGVNYGFPRIGGGSTVYLETTVRARYGGTYTNWFHVRANYRPDQRLPLILNVAGDPPPPTVMPRLYVEIQGSGLVLFVREAPPCETVIETSSDLRAWNALPGAPTLNAGRLRSAPISLGPPVPRFFRLRCQ